MYINSGSNIVYSSWLVIACLHVLVSSDGDIQTALLDSIHSTEVLDLAQDKGRWRRLVHSVEVQ